MRHIHVLSFSSQVILQSYVWCVLEEAREKVEEESVHKGG